MVYRCVLPQLCSWRRQPFGSMHTCPTLVQVELGIKLRGNRTGTEVKGLVAGLAEGSQDSPFVGPIEIWVKWWSEALSLDRRRTGARK